MTFQQFMADRIITCKSDACKEDLRAAYEVGFEEGLTQGYQDSLDDEWEEDDWGDNWDDDWDGPIYDDYEDD